MIADHFSLSAESSPINQFSTCLELRRDIHCVVAGRGLTDRRVGEAEARRATELVVLRESEVARLAAVALSAFDVGLAETSSCGRLALWLIAE